MPEHYNVRVTHRVLSDLEGIFAYILKDSPQNAVSMIRTLLDAIDSLELMPGRVYVLRISHGARRRP